jgi:uncharacterized lipoprotein
LIRPRAALRAARWVAPFLLVCLGGCGGSRDMRCEGAMRYATSSTAAPIRVPEDLSLPDESDALQIPNAPPFDVPDPEVERECLETPPDFFEE